MIDHAIVKLKPTSAGRRAQVKVVNPDLYKGRPVDALIEKQTKNAGRNNYGRVTMRHQGGGHKQHYRLVDFRRNKDGIPAKVERIEYDPNRSAHIALLCYADGERRYIIAPRGVEVGQQLISGAEAPIKAGNALPIRNIPVGSTIHCIEMVPGKVRNSRAPPALRCSCSPAKARTPSSACAPARSAVCTSSAAPPSVKSVTASMACARSARLARTAGAVSVRPFAVWR